MEDKGHDNRAIGIYDSGFGGLTIMRRLIKSMPSEDIIYFGDSANAPYGDKKREDIVDLAVEGAHFFAKKKIKALVIACNTVCAYAYREVQKNIEVPAFEIITPSYKMALKYSKIDKIGVIATKATIKSGVYRKSILKSCPQAEVSSYSCPLFVPFIEEGKRDEQKGRSLAKYYLTPFQKKKIDVLLLACSHYPLLKDTIQREIGEGVRVLDPSVSIARELFYFLDSQNLLFRGEKIGEHQFFTSGSTNKFKEVAEGVLGIKIVNTEKKE